jgi:hypothetical protein
LLNYYSLNVAVLYIIRRLLSFIMPDSGRIEHRKISEY